MVRDYSSRSKTGGYPKKRITIKAFGNVAGCGLRSSADRVPRLPPPTPHDHRCKLLVTTIEAPRLHPVSEGRRPASSTSAWRAGPSGAGPSPGLAAEGERAGLRGEEEAARRRGPTWWGTASAHLGAWRSCSWLARAVPMSCPPQS